MKTLFLCTGNSCRSQMAEGWARALRGDVIEAYSAGTRPHGLNPLAVKVMAEVGIDISQQESKHADRYADLAFDYIITVCGVAHSACPIFLGRGQKLHFGFDDPPQLAKGAADEAEALVHYRRVRDEIRELVKSLPEMLIQGSNVVPDGKSSTNSFEKEIMNSIAVYDPVMCCSTGVCGTSVHPDLVNFATLLQDLSSKGATVSRFNLGQQPQAFADNPAVKSLLAQHGVEALPVILVGGAIYMTGRYPTGIERPALRHAVLGQAAHDDGA